MALNPRASNSGSANLSHEPGGIFEGKITLVYGDGTVRVFVRMLGINIGPCRVVGKEYDEQFAINDEVLVAYLDNRKSEMVVIGRLTERLGAEAATTEPIGHEDKTESTISFVNATRIFTIAPVGDSFHVWCVGKRYTKTSAESITLPAVSGLYYIYYSNAGVLSYKTTYFTWDQDAPTAYIYYNSATGEAEFFADERHGVTLDWATHEYLHRTRGASLADGLGASGYTLSGTGSSNADMQISIENGTFFDEDLEVNITHSATPTANTWEQRLQSPAYIPMFYRSGSGGAWVLDTATAYPVKYGSARATYNLSSGGTWSTPDMTSGKFGVTWVVATNNLNEPIIGILGQTMSDNIGQAEDVSYADLDLTGLPIVEIRPLYKLIYETNTGYTNAVKSRLAGIADIRVNQAINFGIGAGALSSLTDVSLTTTVANDVLTYDGSSWTNSSSLNVSSLGISGQLTLGTSGSLIFEGSSDDAYETTFQITDPTADRTITFPNNTGTVAFLADTTYIGTTAVTLSRASANLGLTGITSIAMPGSTSGNLTIQPAAIAGTVTITFPATTGTVVTTGDTGTVTSTMILDGTIVNGDISASAAIADTKLATISTALKVSNSATTATSSNTASAIVARDASGNFTAGTITAALTGNASTSTKAGSLGNGGTGGSAMTFNWSGQSGQPTWLWGGNDVSNMYVYNPSNFSVSYAASAGTTNGGGIGIAYPNATVGGGAANYIGFRWANPVVNCTVDNVISAEAANFSDRRLKTNIADFTLGIDSVRNLRPVSFNPLDIVNFTDEGEPVIGDNDPYDQMLGFIADEVAEVIPSAVSGTGVQLKSVSTLQILSVAVAAIKEMDATITLLKQRIETLENK